MPERPEQHTDLGAYVAGHLDEAASERFAQHLAGCAACQVEERDLREVAELLRRTAPAETPAGMEERTLAAIEAAADGSGSGAPGSGVAAGRDDLATRRSRRAGLGAAAGAAATAACVVAALLIGVRLGEDRAGPEPLAGKIELDTTLLATADSGQKASARVRALGIGREIDFDTRDLPVIPKGQFYELWFVGPGDQPGKPNRISAGTFHPDEQGRSQVTFTAAVDPTKYPVLAVTREPGDGNPSPTGTDLLRSRD